MTKPEAIKELDSLSETGDKEFNHIYADQVILEFLRKEGHEDLRNAWMRAKDRCKFWYA